MEPRGLVAVRNVWTHLVGDLDPKHSVLDFLFKNGEESGIYRKEYEDILNKKTQQARAQALLLQVIKTCPVELFIRALGFEDAYCHLAEALQKSLDSVPVDIPPGLSSSQDAEDTGTAREQDISRAFPRSVIQDFPWNEFSQKLLQTVSTAVQDSIGGTRDLKRPLEEDNLQDMTSLPMSPGRLAPKRLSRGPALSLYRHMAQALHGQWTFDAREGDVIAMKLAFDAKVRSDPDVRFLAYFFDVHFKLASPVSRGLLGIKECLASSVSRGLRDSKEYLALLVSRGLDSMKECMAFTSNPTLSLLMYLTAKGRVALEAGRLQEAKGILEAAEANAQLMEHSLETLYFLRVFSILKQKFLHSGDGGTTREEYNLVLAMAGDIADQFSFSHENKGLLSVVHWHRARAYLQYDPDRDPPFLDMGESGIVTIKLLRQDQAPASAALEVVPASAALEVGQGVVAKWKLTISESDDGFAVGLKSVIPDSESEISGSLSSLRMDREPGNVALPLPAPASDPPISGQLSVPAKRVEKNWVQSSRARADTNAFSGGDDHGQGGGGGYGRHVGGLTTFDAMAAAISAASHALAQVETGLGGLGEDGSQKGCHCLVKAAIAGRQGHVTEAQAWLARVFRAAYSSALTLARARRLQRYMGQIQTPKVPDETPEGTAGQDRGPPQGGGQADQVDLSVTRRVQRGNI